MGIQLIDALPSLHSYIFPLLILGLFIALFCYRYFDLIGHEDKKPVILWTQSCLLLLVSVITFSAYYSLRIQTTSQVFNEDYPSAREVVLDVAIQESGSYSAFDGYMVAIVMPVNNHLRRLHNKERIFLSVQSNETLLKHWKAGTQLKLAGLHRYFSFEDLKKPFYQRLSHKRVYSKLTHIRSIQIIPNTSSTPTFFHKLNTRLQNILSLGAPHNSETHNIYLAMLLGEKEQLLHEQKQRFMETGTMHLFAVSGLHIGIITLFIAQLLACLQIHRFAIALITLPLIFIFIQTIGCPPSAMRAFIMISIYWVSLLIRRQPNAFSALILSALIILTIDPWQLHSLGFRLSYTVVTSILLFGLPLNRWAQSRCKYYAYLPKENWSYFHKAIEQLSNTFIMLFAISFSAWLGSLPICLEIFGYVSTSGIVANILLIQIAGLIILTGISSLILGLFHLSTLSEFINHAAWLLLYFIDSALIFLKALPFPVFESNPNKNFPAILVILPYFSILYLWHTFPKLLKRRTIWIPPLMVILSTYLLLFVQ